jgi:hypothetical protein
MPVIGQDDYLQFQRNLIAESQVILGRATAIENRVSQERQAQAARQQQEQSQAANMALALKKLAFDEQVQKARESYNNQTIQLQRDRLKMQQNLQDEQMKLSKVKLTTAELERDALQVQVNRTKSRGENVVKMMKSYQNLLAARRGGAEGQAADPQAVNKAALDFMASAMVDPGAAEEFSKGMGVAGLSGLLPEDMAPLSARNLMSQIEERRASLVPEQPKPAAKVAQLNWLEKQQKNFVQKHAQMTVPGYGTFAGTQSVVDAKEDYYKSNWREAQLVNQQVGNIQRAGLLGIADVNALIAEQAILGKGGQGIMKRLEEKVKAKEDASEAAKKTTISALQSLAGIRDRVVSHAAGYDMIKGMMMKREAVVRETVFNQFSLYENQPNWAEETTETSTRILEEGSEQLTQVFNDNEIMAAIANYRNDLDPNSETWRATKAAINERLAQMGLDSGTRRYMIDLIRHTHPAAHMTFPPKE